MHKTLLIARHRIHQTAGWAPFWLSLLVGPPLVALLWSGLNLLWQWNMTVNVGEVVREVQLTIQGSDAPLALPVGYIDDAGVIRALPGTVPPDRLVHFPDESVAQQAVQENRIAGYYLIPEDYVRSGVIRYASPNGQANPANDTLFKQIIEWNLARAEGSETAWRIADSFRVEPAPSGSPAENMLDLSLPPLVLLGLSGAAAVYFAIYLTGGVLLSPLAREREGRILEVLLGSVSPVQLLVGKFIGALGICFMQLASWLFWAGVWNRQQISLGAIPPDRMLAIALTSIAGFVVYAAFLSMYGAWIETDQESERITSIAGFATVLPLFGLVAGGIPPDGTAAVALSVLPLFSFPVMLWRLLAGTVPAGELALSLLFAFFSSAVFLGIAVLVFRRRILFAPRWKVNMEQAKLERIARAAVPVWIGTLAYFPLVPASAHNGWLDVGVGALSVGIICLWILVYRRAAAMWHAVGVVSALLLATLSWLKWQEGLWGTAWEYTNVMVLVLTLDSFVALLAVILLLLWVRDASVWALGIVYVGCPLGLLVVMSRYATQAQMETLGLGESLPLAVAFCLGGFLAVAGSIAFVVNFLRLILREATRRAIE